MRHFRDLSALERKVDVRVKRASRRAHNIAIGRSTLGHPLDLNQVEAQTAALVINLQSFWSNWCRSYYLSVALGSYSSSGLFIRSGLPINSDHDALTVAIRGSLTPKKPIPPQWAGYQEPHWHAPLDLADIIQSSQVTNFPTLCGFLRSAPAGISHLRIIRNYYAHRNHELLTSALSLGPAYLVGSPKRPSDILFFVETGRTVSVIDRWLLDIRRLAGALCS